MSEYEQKARKFLAKHGLEFRAVLLGNDCPPFCEDAEIDKDMEEINTYPRGSHIHGKHYRCTFSGKGRGHFSIDFWSSYADEEHNAFRGLSRWEVERQPRNICARMKAAYGKPAKTPTPYDVLACITKSDPGTFENFCAEFGYDEDSRRAERVYHAVQKEWGKAQRFFTDEELEEVREIS